MESKATRIRWGVVGVTTFSAFLLYLDRYCVNFAGSAIQQELNVSPAGMGLFVSAFFWSYALFQVPAGWLGQRFGIRATLTAYILLWSLFTGLLGFVSSVTTIIAFRFLCGLAQAGAFPCAGRAVRDWLPMSQRGIGSACVTFGGRVGGAVTPLLTGSLMLVFALMQAGPAFQPAEILDVDATVQAIIAPPKKAAADWYRKLRSNAAADAESSELVKTLVDADRERLITFLNDPSSLPPFLKILPWDELPPDLRRRLESWETLSPQHQAEGARRFWESALPQRVKRLEARGWRPVVILFGGLGVFVALGFWWLFREDPAQHPWCNPAEVELIHRDWPQGHAQVAVEKTAFPWRFLLTNPSLWGNSVMQFMTNIGWLFLGTTLPRYLDEVHHVPVIQRSFLASVPLFAGWLGIVFGGPWTDRWTAWKGRKWGRRGPIACSRFLAVFGYLLVLAVIWEVFGPRESLTAIWVAVAGLSVVAIATDLGVPATWAFAQDVGGKHTSSVLGWANMWGNIGAAVFSLFSEMILGKTPGLTQWTLLCVGCAAAFVISGFGACLMDASRPLDERDA